MFYYGFKPYVSVGARRRQAARELARFKKKGRHTSPVVIEGRTIAETFWGEAWCDNLERYSDFANRLPRGRTYVRHGSVVDLQIAPGRVTALVSGSMVYDVNVTVTPVPQTRWTAICKDCSGAIDSLVELLQGRFSKGVMTRLCEEKTGLFPSPKEIIFTCSCPDWASMCKHVAAVLYGIGARLDHQPELLFTLRKVDQQDLITKAGSDLSKPRKGPANAKVLATDDLAGIFGIEIATSEKRRRPSPKPAAEVPVASPTQPSAKPPLMVKRKTTATIRPAPTSRPKKRPVSRRITRADRRAMTEAMRKYWAARRAQLKARKSDSGE